MRLGSNSIMALLACAALSCGASVAAAQGDANDEPQAGQSTTAQARGGAGQAEIARAVGPCKGRPDTIGVSRVVEIDTEGGPGFGQQQYKGNDFLEPGEVVLTFDDGPLRHNTQKVLAALDAECTRATFFSVGKMAVADPQMVREIASRGHTVGTHTWSHRNLRAAAPANALGEVELGVSAVSKALGQPVAPFFRFPYLADSHTMITHDRKRNLAMFSIDVDSKDYQSRDPGTMQRRVLAGLKQHGKGIILFHDIQASTANGLAGLLAEMRKRGFKVVHMVSKAPVATMAEYDAIAQRELDRKSKAIAGNPLANRSMTWANSSADTTKATLASPKRKPAVRQPTVIGVGQPVAATPQKQAASLPPPRPRTYRPREEEPWWKGIFGN